MRLGKNSKWKIYILFGVLGVLLSVYTLGVALNPKAREDFIGFLIYVLSSIILFFAALVNFYTAYAFRSGEVDKVTGVKCCADIFLDGRKVGSSVKIRLIRYVDLSSGGGDIGRHVLFIAGYRPWICKEEEFLVKL